MGESYTNVTEGSGKRQHSWQRTISSIPVEDNFVIPGEFPLPSYIASSTAIAASTAAAHCMELMAGASAHVRIRRIRVEQDGLITTAASQQIQVWRLTTAGTGGSVITPRPLDTTDAAATATAMTLPSAKGTESLMIDQRSLFCIQVVPTAGATTPAAVWEWKGMDGHKGLIIPAGTANGISIKCASARAGLTVTVSIEFVETTFAG